MKATLDFVAPNFQMGVPILLAATLARITFRMMKIGLECHGFRLVWFLASSQAFGESWVLYFLATIGEWHIFNSWTM
jgi:hypothetical protein